MLGMPVLNRVHESSSENPLARFRASSHNYRKVYIRSFAQRRTLRQVLGAHLSA